MAAQSFPEPADAVIAEALAWIGTPYRHQGCRKGIGCDCLGLVRGVWRQVYGRELEEPGAYAADWSPNGEGDRLADAARRHFHEKDAAAVAPGDLLLFRWRPHWPARHLGIAVSADRFVHAYEGAAAVALSPLVPQWRRRIAAVFAFPSI
ncbi:MAG: C40 family peptidase [Mesorhizobium sp.]|nr:NlpC/P60 family protein [Mesorhizobium sp.]MBN9244175.1 C40 family peptidase [Mesorhizobium sp.]